MSFLKKKSFLFCMLVGVAVTVMAVFVLFVPAAMLVSREVVGAEAIPLLSGVSLGASLFLSVRFVAAYRKKQAPALGACVFAVCAVIGVTARLIYGGGEMSTWLLTVCVPALFGLFAGVVASNGAGKRKRKGKRY